MENRMSVCKHKSLGCNAYIENDLLNEHYKRCKFTSCSNKYNNQNCKTKGTRIDIQHHMKERCNFRIVSCNGDGKCQIPFCELDSHNCLVYLLNQGIQNCKEYQNKQNSVLHKNIYIGHKSDLKNELIFKYVEIKNTEKLFEKILHLTMLNSQ
jgi:hypothetical protein